MSEQADTSTDWKLKAKIGLVFLVALGAIAFAPTVLRDPGTDHGTMAALLSLFGAIVMYGGWHKYKSAQVVRNTPTSKVRSMAVGAVEVKGDAHPVDEPLTSPLTHQDACMYSLKVEEHRPDHDNQGPDWHTVLTLSDTVPFHLDDGTGRVRVEPEDATLQIEVEDRVRVGNNEEPPAALGEWAEAEGIVESADEPDPEGIKDRLGDLVDSATADSAEAHLVRSSGRSRRYKEKVLAAGESTYVFGGAKSREGASSAENERNLVVREHDGTGRFIVSDQSEEEIVSGSLFASTIGLALGLVLLTYGLGAFLFWAGIL